MLATVSTLLIIHCTVQIIQHVFGTQARHITVRKSLQYSSLTSIRSFVIQSLSKPHLTTSANLSFSFAMNPPNACGLLEGIQMELADCRRQSPSPGMNSLYHVVRKMHFLATQDR